MLARNLALVTLGFALTPGSAPAHEGPGQDASAAVAAYSSAQYYAPTPYPDRVVLTWSGDPRTSIDVTWRTCRGVGPAACQFKTASELLGDMASGEVAGADRVAGTSAPFATNLGPALAHSAKIEGLAPGTMYVYRVGDGRRWSEWHQFRTAAATDEPFTFVYFGDAQNAVRSLWSRVVREANQHAPRAAFLLHAGDLVNVGDNDAEWGEWFAAGGWLNGMIPSVATPGNHEYGLVGLTRHWRPQFAFPLNGPTGLEETAYWFDYQGMRIISLNSNERVEEQAEWLDRVLAEPGRPKWTAVTFHHPIFSAARERDNLQIREAWRPILERHGVDLVLQGHDHAYARSGLGGPANFDDADSPTEPIASQEGNVPTGVRAKRSNTVYVVSVSGPKMYELNQAWDVSRVASGAQLFQVIHVSRERIHYEARLATGEIYDAFTLTKGETGESTLTEEAPETPAIRR